MPKSSRPLVLQIEDEKFNRELIKAALEILDLEIIDAANAEEGIKLALEKKPDLILLDIHMPGINGFEACRRLKTDPQSKAIAVIMLSALDEKEDAKKISACGADDYIAKPIDIDQLNATVKKWLKR